MKKFILFFLLAAGSLWFVKYGPEYIPQEPKQIVIYTKSSDSDCIEITQKICRELNTAKLHYRTLNVDHSENAAVEMRQALRKKKISMGRARLPVVVINNRRVLTAPNPAYAAHACGRPLYSWSAIRREWIQPVEKWFKQLFRS